MKKFLAIALAAVMLFAFAACGSKTKTDATNTDAAAKVKVIDIALSSEEYAFGVDKEQPELLAQVNTFIEKIKNDGTFDAICAKYLGEDKGDKVGVASAEYDANKDQLIVATNAEFPPFEYKEGDLYYGIDMEIAALLAKELGKELVINNMDFEAVCLSVEDRCDIAMAGLSVNPEREKSVTFSVPYYESAQKIIVKADDTRFDACKTAEEVVAEFAKLPEGTKIGAQTGTTGALYIKGDEAFGFSGIANAEAVTYDSAALATTDLLNGRVAFVIVDADPAAAIVAAVNG